MPQNFEKQLTFVCLRPQIILFYIFIFFLAHTNSSLASENTKNIIAGTTLDAPFEGSYLDHSKLNQQQAHIFTKTSRCIKCHGKELHQYQKSAHRHASITNPYYLDSLRSLINEKGADTALACVGCHDISLYIQGKYPEAFLENSPYTTQYEGEDYGVPCLTCHGGAQITSQVGNASLSLSLPDEPLLKKEGIWLWLEEQKTKMYPKEHKQRMMPRNLKNAQLCGACHQAFLHQGINANMHTRGQTERDSHQQTAYAPQSGVSGALSLTTKHKNCIDCHMNARSEEHATLTANTALYAFNNDRDSIQKIQKNWLENPPLTISLILKEKTILRIHQDGQISKNYFEDNRTKNKFELEFLIKNTGVGHTFPAGTQDTAISYLQIQIFDRNNTLVIQNDEKDLHYFGKRILNNNGKNSQQHTTETLYTELYNHSIKAGEAQIARFYLDINENLSKKLKFPLQIKAKVYYQKFSEEFSKKVQAPLSPKLIIAEYPSKKTLNLIQIYSDYALNSFKNWDDTSAEEALDYARDFMLSWGASQDQDIKNAISNYILVHAQFLFERKRDTDAALKILDTFAGLISAADQPRHQISRAQIFLQKGEAEKASILFEQLYKKFKKDRKLSLFSAKALRRIGQNKKALKRLEKLLKFRPDDFEAYQLAMAIAAELGKLTNVKYYRKMSERVRPSRDQSQVALKRMQEDLWAKKEADRIHTHQLIFTGEKSKDDR